MMDGLILMTTARVFLSRLKCKERMFGICAEYMKYLGIEMLLRWLPKTKPDKTYLIIKGKSLG